MTTVQSVRSETEVGTAVVEDVDEVNPPGDR